jgi:hypothetical protein
VPQARLESALIVACRRETNVGLYRVSAAVHGGPIAVAPERTAFSQIGGIGASHKAVRVYTGNGRRLSVVEPPGDSSQLVAVGWTAGCRLVILRSNGAVDLFSPLGDRLRESFSLPLTMAARAGGTAPTSISALAGPSRSGEVVMAKVGMKGLAAVVRVESLSEDVLPGAPPEVETRYVLVVCSDLDGEDPGSKCWVAHDTGLADRCPACVELLDQEGAEGVDVIVASSEEALPALYLISQPVAGEPVPVRAGVSDALSHVVEGMSVSPSGEKVLLVSGLTIMVCTAALNTVLFEKDVPDALESAGAEGLEDNSGRLAPPDNFSWMGQDDAVCLLWQRWGVLVIPPGGDAGLVRYSQPAAIIPEIDGLRILTATHHDLLAVVPLSTLQTRRPGIPAPSARLVIAQQEFERREPSAMATLQELLDGHLLEEAVATCLEAAEEEHDVRLQQQLLRAAHFGMRASEECSADRFVVACRRLRALNAVRRPEVGLGLTIFQLETLSDAALVERLALLHRHDVALRICRCLGVRPRKVLQHWAATKVASASKQGLSDNEICSLIVERLKFEPGVSFADIAESAFTAGRVELAKRLVAFEPQLRHKVPLLLKMREGTLALDTALRGGDMALVALVVSQLRDRLAAGNELRFAGSTSSDAAESSGDPDLLALDSTSGVPLAPPPSSAAAASSSATRTTRGSSAGSSDTDTSGHSDTEHGEGVSLFFSILSRRPAALAVAEELLREKDPRMLQKLLEHSGRWVRSVQERFRRANATHNFSKRKKLLLSAETQLQRGIDAGDRSLAGLKTVVEEHRLLLDAQNRLETEMGLPGRFLGEPLSDTLMDLLRIDGDHSKRATALCKAFHVPESRWWMIRIQAVVEARRWDALETLANEKRSPVGYVPFVQACLRAEPPNTIMAGKMALKIDNLPERLAMQIDCEAWDDAAETAKRVGTSDAASSVLDAMDAKSVVSDVRRKLNDLVRSGR